jgi:hypothetical protein
MFKRRRPLTKLQLLKEIFWPSMGWARMVLYLKYRVVRLSDSTPRIANGLACGAAVSFSPLVGTHFVQAAILAYLIRGNILASLIGTAVGNPWTFPFMWYASYVLGVNIFTLFGVTGFESMPEELSFSGLLTIISEKPLSLFIPWLIGGYVLVLLSWPFYYIAFYFLVRAGKNVKRLAKEKRAS